MQLTIRHNPIQVSIKALMKAWLLALVMLVCLPQALAEEKTPSQFEGVTIHEKLGKSIDPSLQFTDSEGKTVTLGDYFKDDKPVLLTLNYYDCTTLCDVQINGLLQGLRDLSLVPGKDFNLVTVSFDTKNTPMMASHKQHKNLQLLEKEGAKWSFLVGDEKNVRTLADSLGFMYRYDAQTDQFAHSAAIYFMSPSGVISRYLYGIEYSARDLKFALIDASEGKIGTTVERLLLNCFHYDIAYGRYTPFAMRTMRFGGVFSVVFLGTWLGLLWRRDRARKRREYMT